MSKKKSIKNPGTITITVQDSEAVFISEFKSMLSISLKEENGKPFVERNIIGKRDELVLALATVFTTNPEVKELFLSAMLTIQNATKNNDTIS